MTNQVINKDASQNKSILEAQKQALWRAVKKLKRLDREVKELEGKQ